MKRYLFRFSLQSAHGTRINKLGPNAWREQLDSAARSWKEPPAHGLRCHRRSKHPSLSEKRSCQTEPISLISADPVPKSNGAATLEVKEEEEQKTGIGLAWRTELNFESSAIKTLMNTHVCTQTPNLKIRLDCLSAPCEKVLAQVQLVDTFPNDFPFVAMVTSVPETTMTPLSRGTHGDNTPSFLHLFPVTRTVAEISFLDLPLAQNAPQYSLGRRPLFNTTGSRSHSWNNSRAKHCCTNANNVHGVT